MQQKILFDEQGLQPGTPYEKGQWREIVTHNELEIKGFFGEYKFLSNFWPAKVTLDNEEYSCVENAYQAAKYRKGERGYLKTCTAKEAIVYVREHPLSDEVFKKWDTLKLEVMRCLLVQKFDKNLNPEVYEKLQTTTSKYLEETNYWGDIFWGVHTTSQFEKGEGENNLGKLIMEIRNR